VSKYVVLVRTSSESDVCCVKLFEWIVRKEQKSSTEFLRTPHHLFIQNGRNTPSHPSFRANSFPKVTNLFCRIPLPTFFYALEAIHLGNLRRFSVRRRVGRTFSKKMDTAIFKERDERTEWFPKKRNHSAVNFASSLRKGIPTTQIQNVKKKRGLFSVPIPPCCRFVALPRNLPLWRRSGILTRFPFAVRLLYKESKTFKSICLPLRSDLPVTNRCSHGTFFHFSLQGLHLNSCYFHQDLH